MVWVYLCNFVSLRRGTFHSPPDKGSSGAFPLPTVIILSFLSLPSYFLPYQARGLGLLDPWDPGLGYFYDEEILFNGP